MIDQQVNTFMGGMDLDVDKGILPASKYRESTNIRLLADGDNYIIENIDGNKYSFAIPLTSRMYRIEKTDVIQDDIGGMVPYLTIQLDNVYIINNRELDPSISIESLGSMIYTLVQSARTNITVVYNDTSIVLLEQTGKTLSVTLSYINGFKISVIHEAITSPRVIGDIVMRDEIYLFTTNAVTPGDQIWKLKLQEYIPTITLIYSGILGFDLDHIISGNSFYENDNVKKLYWTDNLNLFRYCNVCQSDILCNYPSDFEIVSELNLSKPKVTNIGQGSLKNGDVQYAYQLYRKYINISIASKY